MRRLMLMAALAAATTLAGCTLKTPEGAACDRIGEVDQCPEGQRCGADGTCSVAAMACEEICSSTTCSGQELRRCTPDALLICASIERSTCGDHQECHADAGACECPVAGCTAFRECKAVTGGTSCECVGHQGCTEVGTMCAGDGTATIECVEEPDGCRHPLTPKPCDLGKTCSGVLPGASCECPPSGSTPETGCAAGAEATCTGDGKLLTCVPVVEGSSCSVWRLALDCAGNGLTCTPGGVGACTCPSPGGSPPTLFADTTSPTHPLVQPNGANLDRCRFTTLRAALAAADQGSTVKAGRAGAVSRFSEPSFAVPGEVKLVGDESAPARPSEVEIELTGVGVQGLVLESGASLSGVTVRRAAGAAATTGIEVRGASPATGPSLMDVVVDAQGAGGAFDTGVLVSGAGAVSIQGLTVLDAKASGLQVLRAVPSDAVAVADLLAKRNTIGVKVEVGDLSLSAASIELSAQQGILAVGGAAAVGLDITNSTIKFNQRGGVRAGNLSRFHLSGSKLCRNGALPEDVPGLATPRTFGGLLLIGEAPVGAAPGGNSIKDSTFTDNDGDQVAVLSSRAAGGVLTTWDLAPGACGPTTTNVFNGYNSSADPVSGLPLETGLFASDAGANATRSAWQVAPPLSNRDYLPVAGGVVTSGTEGGALNYCTLLQVEADTTCPDVPPLP